LGTTRRNNSRGNSSRHLIHFLSCNHMPKYEYSALDKNRSLRTGTLQANSELELQQLLAQKKLNVTHIAVLPEHSRKQAQRIRSLKSYKIAHFAKQLAALLKAKMPLLQCIELLERQEYSPKMKRVLLNIKTALYDGRSFSDALESMPSVFDSFFISMVQAGEASGKLDISLSKLSHQLNKAQQTKRKIQNALTYPAIVLGVSIIVVALLVIFVIPKFQFVFENMLGNAPMPVLTQFVFETAIFIKNHFLSLLFIGIVLTVIAKRLLNPKALKSWLLRVPRVRGVLIGIALIRFYNAMGTLLANNVPVVKALEITHNLFDITYFEKRMLFVIQRVREGAAIGNALQVIPLIPETDISLISVGEASGNLPEAFLKIAADGEEDLEKHIGSIVSLLEPMLIIGLTVFIGGIIIAMFLPLLGILDKLSYI